jgi:hypothetical protein
MCVSAAASNKYTAKPNHVYATHSTGFARARVNRRTTSMVTGKLGASAMIAIVAATVTGAGQCGAATNRHQM